MLLRQDPGAMTMHGGKVSVALPSCALLVPWIAGPAMRHRHAPLLLVVALLLAAAAMLRRPGFRTERLVLPVLLAATWPSALLAPVGMRFDIGRGGLIAGAFLLLLLGLLARMLRVRRSLSSADRTAGGLLERSFPDWVPLARAELGLLWFGLFRWRSDTSDAPANAIAFPATATGTEIAMCYLSAAGLAIETPLLHLLLAHVSGAPVAWGCTALHAVFALYLIGYAKSLQLRPTLLFPDRLEIRLGVLARRVVPRASIEAVAPCTGRTSGADEERLFGLDQPNLRLSTVGAMLLFRVDDPTRLMRALATS